MVRTASPDARAYLAAMLIATGSEDRAAFREVYRLTSAKLFGICLRICGDRSAAEDVLHDVYLTIWRRAGAWEPGRASPITWLATVARNRAIDWRRAQGGRQTRPIAEAPDIADSAPDAEARLVADGERHRLVDCLEELEDRSRAAIHTAFFDGLTYAEIAERAAVPLGTAKSWIRRGLARLKECLDRDG
ncbi:sigma-70 family RNA polymerase sigma factor [Sphingomonas sp. S-NIH.Pt15_0812]|jgi:RNA polymerase sigma-70 factor (ECF subfamily)|uniref:sigma-70 family RNA polymerase sigma factor n=1 Tax=Sphingomonas sp. S-NIH.Pt15_0812 TaxID=1920129 RepID=UPI000F7D7B9A|nr:sigma-70 family RNA polymerase sigma factor [Sphingomonas sp. S-NIH.Pt15_0812]RSU50489.1 RNA polymerase subunit sigma [Sphingomonas sp. S-NIH.Pt15_0812]